MISSNNNDLMNNFDDNRYGGKIRTANNNEFDKNSGVNKIRKKDNDYMQTNKTRMAGRVTTAMSGELNDTDHYRKYVGTLECKAEISGSDELSVKSIMYEIGIRSTQWKDMLKPLEDKDKIISQKVLAAEITRAELLNIHRKHSNFSASFDWVDLSAIGYQLSKAIAVYNATGKITPAMLRGGKHLRVTSLATVSQPVSASDSSIFIPRIADILEAPATFTALVCAANAYDALVVTDYLEVSPNNSAKLNEYNDTELAFGCLHALRILMMMYSDMQSGSTMAWAITKGFHSVNTVVAHSDEGGVLRDLFRKGDFCTPFGGIWVEGVRNYVGLPVPTLNDRTAWCSLVDSILLSTACAASVSDPGILIGEKMLPTIFSTVCESEEDRISDNERKLVPLISTWSKKYGKVLANLFGVVDDAELVISYLTGAGAMMIGSKSRHLKYKVTAPFFWVEPTSVIDLEEVCDIANEFCSPLANSNNKKTVPLMADAEVLNSDSQRYVVSTSFTSVRTTPMFNFLNCNSKDGLANVYPMKFDDTKMGLVGGENGARDKRDNRQSLDKYVWTRGQSKIAAPSEMFYTGSKIAFVINVMEMDDWDVRLLHSFTKLECTTELTYLCSRPTCVKIGKLGSEPREIYRERNNAVRALENARNSNINGLSSIGSFLDFSSTEPGDIRPIVVPESAGEVRTANVVLEPRGNNGEIMRGATRQYVYSDRSFGATPVQQNRTVLGSGSGGVASGSNENQQEVRVQGGAGEGDGDVGPSPPSL